MNYFVGTYLCPSLCPPFLSLISCCSVSSLSFFVLYLVNSLSFLHLLYLLFNVTVLSFHLISIIFFFSTLPFISLLFFTLYSLLLFSCCTYFLILHPIVAHSLSFYFSLSHTDILPRIRKKYPEISIVEFTQRQGDTVFIPGAEQIDSTLLFLTPLYSTHLNSTSLN